MCSVYSLLHGAKLSYYSRECAPVTITDVCIDCNSCKTTELTILCSNCRSHIHASCSGLSRMQVGIEKWKIHLRKNLPICFVLLLGIDPTIYQTWNPTPVLCHNCRTETNVSVLKLSNTHAEEFYSATLAYKANHIILVHADSVYRLFPLVYKWLDIESPVCTCFHINISI